MQKNYFDGITANGRKLAGMDANIIAICAFTASHNTEPDVILPWVCYEKFAYSIPIIWSETGCTDTLCCIGTHTLLKSLQLFI